MVGTEVGSLPKEVASMMYEHPDARETPGLEEYLAAVRSRWPVVLGALLLCVVLAVLFVRVRTATFEGEARVLVNPAPIARQNATQLPQVVLERESGVLLSVRTAGRAVDILGTGGMPTDLLTDVDVRFEPNSDILSVLAVRDDPETAERVSNAFAQAYAELRNEDADAIDQDRILQLTEELETLTATVLQVREQRDELSAALLSPTANAAIGGQVNALNQEIDQLQVELREVRADLSNAQREQQARGLAAEVLQFESDAEASGIANSAIILAGVVAGLILGVSGAWLLDRLDRTAREFSDVELAVGSNVLGSVPDFGLGNRSGAGSLVMRSNGRSVKIQRARESFRRLRSSLQFHSQTHGQKSYVVTSARPGEGKSVTVANLAIAAAQTGAEVVLISADMRRPSIEKLLGLPQPEQGLSTYLAGSDRGDIALRVDSIPRLTVIPSGVAPANPGELLAGPRFGNLLRDLSTKFDYILIDAPPVLSAADSVTAAAQADAVIVVVDSQRTEFHELERMSAEIRRAGGSVAGAILNRERSDGNSIFKRDKYDYEKASAVGAS